MSNKTHVVALCGSLADDSGTRIALREALDAAEDANATTTFVDLRHLDLPIFDADDKDAGDAPELRRTVREADAVLLGTPLYHGSYSSPLKAALDYCGFDEFEGKTVGLLAVAGGSFPTPAIAHLRGVCRGLRAWTLPLEVAVPASGTTFEDGEITHDQLADRIRELGTQLTEYAGVEQYPDEVTSSPEAVSD